MGYRHVVNLSDTINAIHLYFDEDDTPYLVWGLDSSEEPPEDPELAAAQGMCLPPRRIDVDQEILVCNGNMHGMLHCVVYFVDEGKGLRALHVSLAVADTLTRNFVPLGMRIADNDLFDDIMRVRHGHFLPPKST